MTMKVRSYPYKFRMLLGFLSITTLISVLYIIEGFSASLDFGEEVEKKHLSVNALHVLEYLSENKHLTIPTTDLSEHIHSPFPAAVIISQEKKPTYFLKDISKANFLLLEKEIIASANHDKGESMGAIELNSHDYFWIKAKEGEYDITIIQQSSISEDVISSVLPRLLISSLVVLWIGFWASLAVSTFISKRISASNKAIEFAATHDIKTGLTNSTVMIKSLSECCDQTAGSLTLISIENLQTIEHTYGQSYRVDIIKYFNELLLTIFDPQQHSLGTYRHNTFYVVSTANISPLFLENAIRQIDKPIMSNCNSFCPTNQCRLLPYFRIKTQSNGTDWFYSN